MKTVSWLIFFFLFVIGSSVAIRPIVAQEATTAPLITLTAENKPLGDILEAITRDTGYHFKLNRAWHDHPVSANITNLQIESVLKRLLRNLNHTIIWESDTTATIMILSKAVPSKPGGRTVSLSLPPQTNQQEPEPTAEPESGSAEEIGPVTVEAEGEDRNAITEDDPKPEQDQPVDPSAEPAEQDPSATEEPTGEVKIES